MNRWGAGSLRVRATLHPDLQKVCDVALQRMDHTLVEGFRGRIAQEIAYAKGATQLHWPKGNHNKWPSTAVDIAPFPIDWSDRPANLERYVYLAGIYHSVGIELNIPIRWGGDWNSNNDMRDENFRDRDHQELLLPRQLSTEEILAYGAVPV